MPSIFHMETQSQSHPEVEVGFFNLTVTFLMSCRKFPCVRSLHVYWSPSSPCMWTFTCILSHYICGSVLSTFPFTSLSLSVDRIDLPLQSMENYLCLQPSIMSSVFFPTTTAKNQQPAGHICYFCKYLLRFRISNRKSKKRKDILGLVPLFFLLEILYAATIRSQVLIEN